MGSNANTYGLSEMDLFLVQLSLLKGLCGNQCWFWGEFSRKMEVKLRMQIMAENMLCTMAICIAYLLFWDS